MCGCEMCLYNEKKIEEKIGRDRRREEGKEGGRWRCQEDRRALIPWFSSQMCTMTRAEPGPKPGASVI